MSTLPKYIQELTHKLKLCVHRTKTHIHDEGYTHTKQHGSSRTKSEKSKLLYGIFRQTRRTPTHLKIKSLKLLKCLKT